MIFLMESRIVPVASVERCDLRILPMETYRLQHYLIPCRAAKHPARLLWDGRFGGSGHQADFIQSICSSPAACIQALSDPFQSKSTCHTNMISVGSPGWSMLSAFTSAVFWIVWPPCPVWMTAWNSSVCHLVSVTSPNQPYTCPVTECIRPQAPKP